MLQFTLILFNSVIVVCIIARVVVRIMDQRSKPEFDPSHGPSTLPILGNIWSLRHNAAEQCRLWKDEYGDVFRIRLGQDPSIVVNSAAAAAEIFNSKSLGPGASTYTFHQIIEQSVATGTAADSKLRNRSIMFMPTKDLSSCIPMLDVESRDLLRRCLDQKMQPINPLRLFQRLSINLDLTLTFGRRIGQESSLLDRLVETEQKMMDLQSPFKNLQEYARIMPEPEPWSPATAQALKLCDRLETLHRGSGDIETGKANDEYDKLEQSSNVSDGEKTLICLMSISAGMAPIVAVLLWTVALLAQKPWVQLAVYNAIQTHRATNDEISMLGDPEHDQECAYLVAFVKEIQRFFTVIRTSLPRVAIKGLQYQGGRIPEGSTVILNAWACNRDPAVYPDPAAFDPLRFLDDPDLPLFKFGVGPGSARSLTPTDRLLYLVLLRLISSFKILPTEGHIDVDPRNCKDSNSLVAYPKAYNVIFKPRDEDALRAELDPMLYLKENYFCDPATGATKATGADSETAGLR